MAQFREYTVKGNVSDSMLFCPRCHRRVKPPSWLDTSKIKCENGICLACGDCKKGKIRIKFDKMEALNGN